MIFYGFGLDSDSADAADWYNENCVGLFPSGSVEDCEEAEYDAESPTSFICCGMGGLLFLVGALQFVRDRKTENVELETKVQMLQSELDSFKQDEDTE